MTSPLQKEYPRNISAPNENPVPGKRVFTAGLITGYAYAGPSEGAHWGTKEMVNRYTVLRDDDMRTVGQLLGYET